MRKGNMEIKDKLFTALRGGFSISDPNKLMAAEIVIGAVNDWRRMIKNKAWLDKTPNKFCNFEEIRIFFRSDWCALLLNGFNIQPARILEVLEEELRIAKLQPVNNGKRKARKNGRNC